MLMAELPIYQCHKKVWALKIRMVKTHPDGSHSIVPEDLGFAPIDVSEEYMIKHDPKDGGYYVVYADGYKSYSPAEPFESGYTRI